MEQEVPFIDSVSIINEFQYVIPEDLPGVPPKREINFNVDLAPNTNPISIPLFKMALAKLKELKL